MSEENNLKLGNSTKPSTLIIYDEALSNFTKKYAFWGVFTNSFILNLILISN